MKMRFSALATAGLLTSTLMVAAPLVAHAAPSAAPEPKTAEAVVAADEAWGTAEENGDADFVDWLLEPQYQSVGHTGKSASKAKIVVGARNVKDPAARKAETEAWRASHPSKAEVAIFGDTAVLTWVSTKPSDKAAIYSSDIFTYRDGHWHAVYSHHSEVPA